MCLRQHRRGGWVDEVRGHPQGRCIMAFAGLRVLRAILALAVSTALISPENCPVSDQMDLSPLNRWPWEVITNISGNKYIYRISFCKKAWTTHACQDWSICRLDSKGTAVNIGSYSDSLNYTVIKEKGELRIEYHGGPCPENKGRSYSTFLIMKCAYTLGSPQFLQAYACDTYFEWYTTVACAKKPTVKEVPCSLYNGDGRKVDLSPLILTKGSYHVNAASTNSDFYINVCREITSDSTATSGCKTGSSSCQTSASQAANMGNPSGVLKYENGKLVLHYTIDDVDKPSGCFDKPSTTITFLCPKRGGGEDPILTSTVNCQYEVLWKTEYACPAETLTSKSCLLTEAIHGVEFDLTPLKNPVAADHPYRVDVPHGDHEYWYFINVCEELGIDCPDADHKQGISVCQEDTADENFGKSLGRLDHQILRYSDGDLSLTYQSGDPCSDNFTRTTVINFHCNESAVNGGRGKPVFNTENDCTYIFDWDTRYACLDQPKMCQVDVNKKKFDLSGLIRGKGSDNWEALTSKDIAKSSRYYINICGEILESNNTKACPEKASACLIDQNGNGRSLGKYLSDPVFIEESNNIKLTYTGGSKCGDQNTVQTTVTLTCKPGDLESGPVLVHHSDNGCQYDFEWQTAAACVLGRKTGTNCQVFDDDAGFSFDLSRLTKTGKQAYHKISGAKYDYFINVCQPVTGTACSDEKTGICQVEKVNQGNAYSLGRAVDNLSYFDGMINLTYSNGTFYHSTPPVARKTEIAFLCDPSAGEGKPEFQHEGDHTYTFRWLTKYACAEVPLECVVTDTKSNKQYDLSSLSKSEEQENWAFIEDSDSHTKKKFYLNVCRPVNPVHVGSTMCDAFAAACMSTFHNFDEELTIHNLGRALTRPSVEGDGQILLTYSNGSECTEIDGSKKTYTTKIHLRCDEGQLASSLTLLGKNGNCEFSILWETKAACPTKDTESTAKEPCTLKDINSDYIYNLQPLTLVKGSGYYDVEAGEKRFKVNICKASSSCGIEDAAVCEVKDGKVTGNFHASTAKLKFSDDSAMTLTYEGELLPNGDREKVVITFHCHRDIPLGEPKFVRREGTANLFDFDTSLACPPEPVECLISDKHGNQYDLSPLAKHDGSWNAMDTRDSHRDLKYYINVCRPINAIPGTTCPGGPVGGCQVSSGGQSFGLGYIQSKPYVVGNGTISLRYMNGPLCHAGSDQQSHRSTRINFFCSAIEHDPVFAGETPGCEYLFEWRTLSACPIQRVTGTGCKVTDPLYKYEFDLNPLRKEKADYHITGNGYDYLINLCGPLNEGTGDCDGNSGVAACQTKASSDLIANAGLSNTNVTYEDGIMTVEYKGGKCHSTHERTTIIKLMCDHYGVDEKTLSYIKEETDCTYMFEWKTVKACPPYKMGPCAIEDDQKRKYDIGLLTRSDSNYETSANSTFKYILNVCSSVVHTTGAVCPFNSASCLVNLRETDPKKRYHNLGEVTGKMLTKTGEVLKLIYANGEPCGDGQKARTFINLICSETSIDSEPTYASTQNNCDYYFNWLTKAACPLQEGETQGTNCTVKNPETGYTFDLSSLKRDDSYSDTDEHGHSYEFNVCAPVKASRCGSGNVGICQSESGGGRHWSLGDYTNELTYDNGILILNYTGGEECHHNHIKRNTVFSFVCGTGIGSPVFVKETSEDCTYYISWHTQLACEKEVLCLVDNGTTTIDLSPLIKSSGYYLTTKEAADSQGTNAAFYINVCRPLNPIKGLLCPPGSAACRVTDGSRPTSIGLVTKSPYIDKTNSKVTLEYDHGVKCANTPAKNSATKIIFNCDPGATQTKPILEDVTDDCQYIFSWGTGLVCPKVIPKEVQDCVFADKVAGLKYDLSTLRKKEGSYKITVGDTNYYLNVCGGVKGFKSTCEKSAVCSVADDKETSFGLIAKQDFTVGAESLTLTYSNGEECHDTESGNSQIFFHCDPHAGNGHAELLSRSSCSVMFNWKTNLVCPPVKETCRVSYKGKVYDLGILSRDQSSWNLTDKDGNWYWINICQGIHGGPTAPQCPPEAAVCRKTKDGTVDNLGVVSTQDLTVKEPLANDKQLVLRYSEGTGACSHEQRRSNSPAAMTVIEFECANTTGRPVFIQRGEVDDSSCVFHFQWKTRMACEIKRVPVKEVDGVVTDPRSGGQIGLSKLYSRGSNYHATEHRGSDVYDYLVSLEGRLSLDVNEVEASVCKSAVVCQKDNQKSHSYKNLGRYENRTYYMEDDNLEGVYISDQSCDVDASQYFQSVINFHCDKDLLRLFQRRDPTFIFKSKCAYYFDWYSNALCVEPLAESVTVVNQPDGNLLTRGKTKPSTIGAIIGIFSVVILCCVLVIVFHKKERRALFGSKLKGIFRKRSGQKTVRYSVLAQGEDEELLLGGSCMDEDEITNGDVATTSYHDDSDTDMVDI